MTLAQATRFALCLSLLIGPALGAQGKEPPKSDPKTDPKIDPKAPTIVVTTPGVVSDAFRAPLSVDSILTYVQQPYAGGGVLASRDGRYVALNRPTVQVVFSNPSRAITILRGTVTATLYRGTPPDRPTASVRPVGAGPTVRQMFDDMARYSFPQYTMRAALFGTLPAGGIDANDGHLKNNLDSMPSLRYSDADWVPRTTIIVEVGVPYTIRADIGHEVDGMIRYYRMDMTFRYDATGRPIGRRFSRPPPPPPVAGRPSVEVRR